MSFVWPQWSFFVKRWPCFFRATGSLYGGLAGLILGSFSRGKLCDALWDLTRISWIMLWQGHQNWSWICKARNQTCGISSNSSIPSRRFSLWSVHCHGLTLLHCRKCELSPNAFFGCQLLELGAPVVVSSNLIYSGFISLCAGFGGRISTAIWLLLVFRWQAQQRGLQISLSPRCGGLQ